jgi:hypothetical protein
MTGCTFSRNNTLAPSVFSSATEADDDQEENHQAGSGGQQEPQGTRQHAPGSRRHHQGPSRRRKAQHPRAGRAWQRDAEHQQPTIGVGAARAGPIHPQAARGAPHISTSLFKQPGPSLRGAKRRSNPFFLYAARWIASRSLSSGAHSRDPLARNDAVCSLRSSQ